MTTIKDIVQRGREESEEVCVRAAKLAEKGSGLELAELLSNLTDISDSRIIDVLEYSHKEIENIDISIMTYGAFRRQVLSLITSFIDEIKK